MLTAQQFSKVGSTNLHSHLKSLRVWSLHIFAVLVGVLEVSHCNFEFDDWLGWAPFFMLIGHLEALLCKVLVQVFCPEYILNRFSIQLVWGAPT